MKVMEEKWINNLRERFSDKKTAVPDGLWESINASMAHHKGLGYNANTPVARPRKHALLVRMAVSAAACAAMLFGFWILYDKNSGSVQTSTNGRNLATASFAEGQSSPDGGTAIAEAASRLRGSVNKVMSALSGDDDSMTAGLGEHSDTISTNADVAMTETKTERGVEANGKTSDKTVERRMPERKRHSSYHTDASEMLAYGGDRPKARGLSVSVHGSSLASLGGVSGGNTASPYYVNRYSMPLVGDDVVLMSLSSKVGSNTSSEADEVKTKHRQPVRVGVSLRYPLSRRLSIETGANYSYLSSDMAAGDGDAGYRTSQKLHYVGVPLNLGYDIWHTDMLEVYASCGGGVDFCVSGKADTEYIMGDKVVRNDHSKVRDTRPQWSANVSAGVQYNLGRTVGIYAEPGVSYYFDNGSDVSTIYKDKPFNFNLNVGVRLTFR